MKKVILFEIAFFISILIFQTTAFAKYDIEKSYIVGKIQINKEDKIIDTANEPRL